MALLRSISYNFNVQRSALSDDLHHDLLAQTRNNDEIQIIDIPASYTSQKYSMLYKLIQIIYPWGQGGSGQPYS